MRVAVAGVVGLGVLLVGASGGSTSDVPCLWSQAGATFDLRALSVNQQSAKSYYILDGDIPCTPETEPSFSYVWNLCAPVTSASLPGACSNMGKQGVALQYLQLDSFADCYIIGRYDATRDDLHYKLMDPADPTKGVSIVYPTGERCDPKDPKGLMRSTTIDVQCANSKTMVLSANSPAPCQYHLSMKSYYGCPAQCPVTENGLCNSHGHCAYDNKSKTPSCYCNDGHYGVDCSSTAAPKSTVAHPFDGRSVQIALLVILLIVMLAMIAAVAYMAYKIQQYRKEAQYSALGSSVHGPGATMEMVETVTF